MTAAEAAREAKRLVIDEGFTYAQAADATGIPVSTLQKRGAAEDWQGQRQSAASYSAQTRALKVALLQDAAATKDPQKVYAWSVMEKAFPEHRYVKGTDDAGTRLAVGAEVIEALVEHLDQEDRPALTKLAPHLQSFAARWEKRCAA